MNCHSPPLRKNTEKENATCEDRQMNSPFFRLQRRDGGSLSFSPLFTRRSTSSASHSQKSQEDGWSTMDSQECRGTTELTLLQRPQEAIADICVFLAKTFSQLKSASSLDAFVSYVNQKGGARPCCYALRLCNAEAEVLFHLYHGCLLADPTKVNLELVGRVVFSLLRHVEVGLLSLKETTVFLISFLTRVFFPSLATTADRMPSRGASLSSSFPSLLLTDSTSTGATASTTPSTHWSYQALQKTKKRIRSEEEAMEASSSLAEKVEVFCALADVEAENKKEEKEKKEEAVSCREPSSSASISFLEWTLANWSALLLRQNEEQRWCAGLRTLHTAIVEENGLKVLSQALLSCWNATPAAPCVALSSTFSVAVITKLLTVLELLTISPAVGSYTAALSSCASTLCRMPFIQQCPAHTERKTLEVEEDTPVEETQKGQEKKIVVEAPSTTGTAVDSKPLDRLSRSLFGEVELPVLRVLTNITAVDPYAVEKGTARALIPYLCSLILSPLDGVQDLECVTFALCCAINMAKREYLDRVSDVASPSDFFTTVLFSHYDTMIHQRKDGRKDSDHTSILGRPTHETLMALFFHEFIDKLFFFYTSGKSNEYAVVAGYYAILTCILSLLQYCGTSLRVPVITALRHHFMQRMNVDEQEEKEGEKEAISSNLVESTEQPMRIAISLVQEFLVFQSNTGTLCQNAFIEITDILERVMTINKISVLKP